MTDHDIAAAWAAKTGHECRVVMVAFTSYIVETTDAGDRVYRPEVLRDHKGKKAPAQVVIDAAARPVFLEAGVTLAD